VGIMGWYTFQFPGSATVEQPDTETGTVLETGTTFLTLNRNITLQDVVLTAPATNNHQYSFWVNGRKVSSNLYSSELSPASQTRFSIAAQAVSIPANSQVQIKAAQLSGASAEITDLTLVFV
jgi:hypothetical protein